MKSEEAYSYRSFEHYKRETFVVIANMLSAIQGELTILDLGCGPGVFEGVAQEVTQGRISEAWLLDYDPEFCEYARMHLEELIPVIHTGMFDMNDPEHVPDIGTGLSCVVSVNALFHAEKKNLGKIYSFCYEHLGKGGILINHQTFASPHSGLIETYCEHLSPTAVQDPLDNELMRRSLVDAELSQQEATDSGGGGYAGLSLDVKDHIELLEQTGFTAVEVWRKAQSAIVLGKKS